MKFLSTQRFSIITIEDRAPVHFIVVPDVAMVVFWFLASSSAQLVALLIWWLTKGTIKRYYSLCDYLIGWKRDITLIRLALIRLIPDLLTIQVARSFG